MRWYTLHSKPNKESALFLELCAREVEVFYPQLRVHPANPRSRTIRPFFPGYMFVHVDLALTGFSELQWLPFSSGLVMFGGEPAYISEVVIHGIKHHIDEINAAGGERLIGLQRGDPVLIEDGPFAGHEAIFDIRLPDSERVRVLLKVLQSQQIRLELPVGQIQRKKSPMRLGR